jgi:hypothetical protein
LTHDGIGTVLDVTAFSDKIGDHPMLLALLHRFESERQQLAAA